jgi:hypothetical protein
MKDSEEIRQANALAEDHYVKPRVKLVGEDGNIFSIVGAAARALRRVRHAEQATEMSTRVFAAHSYDEALAIVQEYVDAF